MKQHRISMTDEQFEAWKHLQQNGADPAEIIRAVDQDYRQSGFQDAREYVGYFADLEELRTAKDRADDIEQAEMELQRSSQKLEQRQREVDQAEKELCKQREEMQEEVKGEVYDRLWDMLFKEVITGELLAQTPQWVQERMSNVFRDLFDHREVDDYVKIWMDRETVVNLLKWGHSALLMQARMHPEEFGQEQKKIILTLVEHPEWIAVLKEKKQRLLQA